MKRLVDVEELIVKITSTVLKSYEDKKRVLKTILDLPIIAEEDLKYSNTDYSGGYTCFHCLTNSVVWDCDYDFEDFGYEGEGVVHILHCTNCGADIEYRSSK